MREELKCITARSPTIEHIEENIGSNRWNIPEENLTKINEFLEREEDK